MKTQKRLTSCDEAPALYNKKNGKFDGTNENEDEPEEKE